MKDELLRRSSHGDDDLSFGMTSSQVRHGFVYLVQWIGAVDDGLDFSRFYKLPHDHHILSVEIRNEEYYFLARPHGSEAHLDDVFERTDHLTFGPSNEDKGRFGFEYVLAFPP